MYDDQQARQALRSPPDSRAAGPAGSGGKRRRTRSTDVIVSIVLPWLIFLLVISLFLFAYHDMSPLVWILIAACLGLAMVFLFLGVLARHGTFLAIGLLCLTSVVAGVATGLWLHSEYLERFWQLDAGQEYREIHPLANTSHTADASVIHFQNGSFVDSARTVGYVSQGRIYCVAPVSRRGPYNTRVSYWAVGRDCCEMRSNFECGSSRDLGAQTAVTALPNREYLAAVHEALSVYGLERVENAQLVSFVNSPQDMIGDMWDEALSIALIAMIFDLLLVSMAGVLVAKVIIPPPPPTPVR